MPAAIKAEELLAQLLQLAPDNRRELDVWCTDEDGNFDLPIVGVSIFAGRLHLSAGDE